MKITDLTIEQLSLMNIQFLKAICLLFFLFGFYYVVAAMMSISNDKIKSDILGGYGFKLIIRSFALLSLLNIRILDEYEKGPMIASAYLFIIIIENFRNNHIFGNRLDRKMLDKLSEEKKD